MTIQRTLPTVKNRLERTIFPARLGQGQFQDETSPGTTHTYCHIGGRLDLTSTINYSTLMDYLAEGPDPRTDEGDDPFTCAQ